MGSLFSLHMTSAPKITSLFDGWRNSSHAVLPSKKKYKQAEFRIPVPSALHPNGSGEYLNNPISAAFRMISWEIRHEAATSNRQTNEWSQALELRHRETIECTSCKEKYCEITNGRDNQISLSVSALHSFNWVFS